MRFDEYWRAVASNEAEVSAAQAKRPTMPKFSCGVLSGGLMPNEITLSRGSFHSLPIDTPDQAIALRDWLLELFPLEPKAVPHGE